MAQKNLASELGVAKRRLLIDSPECGISIRTQTELLGINRVGLYYKAVPRSEDDLLIKANIDKIYTAHPEYGYRRIHVILDRNYGIRLDPKTVLNHMRDMGIQAIYPRQNTSKPAPGHKIYPYLLKNLDIVRPD